MKNDDWRENIFVEIGMMCLGVAIYLGIALLLLGYIA